MSKRKAEPDPPALRAREPANEEQGAAAHSGFVFGDAFDHPDSNWNRAVSKKAQADPFCCRTEWQLSFHEAMQPGRKLVVRETPGSVIAFAENHHPYLGLLFEPVESGWMFGCPLLGPGAVDLLEELVSEIERKPAQGQLRPAVVISGLRPRGKLLREIAGRFGPRFSFQPAGSSVMCNALLTGGYDGYLSRRSGSQRRSLRKQARRAGMAGVTFERQVPTSQAGAAEVYARMLAVEASSWKGIGRCGMAEQPSRDYYTCMMRRLAVSGNGRVIFARHEECDIGFIFGGLAGKVYRGQQFSYAVDWQAASIGNLMQLEQVRWLCEEGATRYDMGPLMDYKRHWTENKAVIETRVLMRK